MTGEAETTSPDTLHPAEHRAYRELYAASRQLIKRWGRLIRALDGTSYAEALEGGRASVERLLAALAPETARYDLHGGIAAQGFGARIADVRGTLHDRSVDTGMVMRFAVLDIEHVATLLGHLTRLARARADEELAAFCKRWQSEVRPEVRSVRRAAISLGEDPDRAAAPLDDSAIGRAAHGVGWALGSLGEAVDRATGGRRPGSGG